MLALIILNILMLASSSRREWRDARARRLHKTQGAGHSAACRASHISLVFTYLYT
ncbi:MAG TPA: hypothetical protein VK829_14160 [Terriglobales bacterium]|jgi:hypothetical protein|nr:hypothetical protein [Terriglobales bacterium]